MGWEGHKDGFAPIRLPFVIPEYSYAETVKVVMMWRSPRVESPVSCHDTQNLTPTLEVSVTYS